MPKSIEGKNDKTVDWCRLYIETIEIVWLGNRTIAIDERYSGNVNVRSIDKSKFERVKNK